tara:strand:+ start:147 stop:881 length:735 start_codon:yes stop_codon:yes gene_type:complete
MVKIGFIYKIWSKIDDKLVYYGSTTREVCERIKNHQSGYKSWKLGNGDFISSYLIIDTCDWDYITVETVEYDEPYELKERERFWIESNACVNINIPNRTKKQYDEDNKERIAEYAKEWKKDNKERIKDYYEENKEEIKVRAKNYYEDNREQVAKNKKRYRTNNKEEIRARDKKRYEDNREEILARYEDNKEEILARGRVKITCDCGAVVSKDSLSGHKKTKKHINFLAQFETAIDCVKSGVLVA